MASIRLDAQGPPPRGPSPILDPRCSGNNVASAWTDASGAFLLQGGVPAGNYFVRTYNDLGHIDEVFDGVPCTADCALVGATPITVSVGAVSGGIDFLLRRGAQMTGTVRDATTSAGLAEVERR